MKANLLKRLYFFLITFLALIILFTPYLIKDGFSFLTEESVEGATIFFLLLIGLGIDLYYKSEMSKQQKVVDDAWKHVGKMNLFAERLKKLFVDTNECPENKKGLKYLLENMSDKVLGLANYQIVLFRVIETDTMKTLYEFSKARKGWKGGDLKVGNKDLLNEKENPELDIISSTIKNINVKTFCVAPKTDITKDQEIFIRKIVDDITMLYIVFASKYYKK